MSVILPPKDKYNLFRPKHLISILSMIAFQIDRNLKEPKGNPKYWLHDCHYPNPPSPLKAFLRSGVKTKKALAVWSKRMFDQHVDIQFHLEWVVDHKDRM